MTDIEPDLDSEAFDDNHVADYEAEAAVNLRAQRLRRPNVDDTEPEPNDREASAPDPYGVGQDALAAVDDWDESERPYRAQLFDHHDSDPTTQPATWGLRGRLNAALGARLRPKDLSTEARYRTSIRTVQQPLPGCSVVSVINPKGGSGNTITAAMLGSTFGRHRGTGVVVWDACESTGSLGDRAARTTDPELTVWDLLAHASDLASSAAVSGALNTFLRRQPTMEDVLASDNSMTNGQSIGWDECAAVMAILRRHRDLIVIDTGNNPVADNWQWAVAHSDVLVVPLPLRLDMAKQVYQMLDSLISRGLEHLLASTIVVTCVTPDAAPESTPMIFQDLHHLGIPRENFVQAPYEPVLARGERIQYSELPAETIEAYTNVTALVADTLAEARRATTQQYSDPVSPKSLYRRPSDDLRRFPPPPPAQPVALSGGYERGATPLRSRRRA
ncbi:MinD/ParA family ATP-binding protein [Rhodococcoides yunnanense]|uniref:MinD/ParA family ATP-binding protein n=1 Tax=Rhodococcoides yunnanense TaxID=278209 RepID=UPI0009FBB931|nr:hypothetical protein [Rhodococcus yunnanensis]